MAWRLAIRVARREALRSKGRSLMVAAMIALPVAGASAADTLWHSTQLTTGQKATRTMGQYDALVRTPWDVPISQDPDGTTVANDRVRSGPPAPARIGINTSPEASQAPVDTSASALLALLPAGSRVVPYGEARPGQALVTKGAGRLFANLAMLDLSDPNQKGLTVHRSGTAPTSDDEVAVSGSVLKSLGKKVGDSIEMRTLGLDSGTGGHASSSLGSDARTLRVTGVYDLPDELDAKAVFARPGTFGDTVRPTGFLVSVPGGVGWGLVKKLNEHGYAAQSRQVLLSPPSIGDVPLYQQYPGLGQSSGNNAEAYAVLAIAVSMVLLEIILLAGPAFAVGARRRRRDFGLLGAAGADGRRVRQIVLADGVVLGAAGGALGIAVGVVASAGVFPWLSGLSNSEPGGFAVAPSELLAAGAVGVVTGLIAALAPAIATSRQHVLTALTGRGETGTPWKLPIVGLICLGAGSAAIFYGAFTRGVNTLPIIAGIAVAELGAVSCTSMLVALSGRLARFLPLSGRLALRDGARNRGRTAPAVAAVMAAVAGASAVAVILSSSDAKDRALYSTELRPGEVGVSLAMSVTTSADSATGANAQKLADALGAALPTRVAAVEYGPDYLKNDNVDPQIERPKANMCPYLDNSEAERLAHLAAERADPRCHDARSAVSHHLTSAQMAAGGPELVRVLTGASHPAAEEALRNGGVVVFNALDLTTPPPHATVTIRAARQGAPMPAAGPGATPGTAAAPADDCSGPGEERSPIGAGCDRLVTLPAVLVDAPSADVAAVVPPDSLIKVGVRFAPYNVLVDTTRMPTADDEQKADDVAAALGVPNQVRVERGYSGGSTLGLLALAGVAAIVTLGAAAIATGLAITDAQGDLETLVAVGARPRVRRLLAGSQAAVTAGLGALLGAAFGLLPAIGLVEAQANGFAEADYAPGSGFVAGDSYLTIPWLFLGLVVLALPVLAALGASGLTRSRIEMRRRRV